MRQNYIINEEFNRLEFLDSRFYQTTDGKKFPSVTTILEAYPKGPQYFEWLKQQGDNADDILEEAGRLGDTVHKLTESYDRCEYVTMLDENRKPKCKIKDWAMFERYIDFQKRFNPQITHTELNMCSAKLGYGGTLDRRIILPCMNGMKFIIDIKTGNYIWPHMWCQMAAYQNLFTEFYPDEKVDGIALLHLNARTRTDGKKGDIQGKGWKLEFAPKDTLHYLKVFEATRKLWLEEYGDMMPKESSYQLFYQKTTPEAYDGAKMFIHMIDEAPLFPVGENKELAKSPELKFTPPKIKK